MLLAFLAFTTALLVLLLVGCVVLLLEHVERLKTTQEGRPTPVAPWLLSDQGP